jgi:drug/metabolite transporter (DMT)-like permease
VSNIINTLLLMVCTVAVAVGQLLFKHVGLAIRGMSVARAAAVLAAQPEFYAALALYGAATLLWIWILGRVSLMQAYAWLGAGVILVPLLSSHFFGEKAGPYFWAGAALIAVGVVLTQYAAGR